MEGGGEGGAAERVTIYIYIYILGIIDSPEGSKAANHAVLGFVLG